MATKNRAGSEKDLAHRIYIPQMLDGAAAASADTGMAALTGAGTAGPIVPDAFPPEARAHFARPVARIHEAGQGVTKVHAALDLAVVDAEQRQLVQNPQTADACLVARAQAEAFAGQPEIAVEVQFPTEEALAHSDRHDSLRNGATCLADLLQSLGQTRLLVQADRAMARGLVMAHIDGTLGTLGPDDPRHGRFQAAKAHIEAAEGAVEDRVEKHRDKGAEVSAEARGRVEAAAAETEVAEVLFQLRQGIVPDEARLLRAALQLKKLEADRRGSRR